jgi:hypothetical protein
MSIQIAKKNERIETLIARDDKISVVVGARPVKK